MSRIYKSLLALPIVLLSSCFECEQCHQVKIYDGDQIGLINVTDQAEVCTRSEKRALEKTDFESFDDGGDYRQFWVCDVLVDKSEEE